MTVTSLGNHLYLEKSTASRLAKGLIQKGMIRRRAPGRDGRVTILQLTESGRRTARKMENEVFSTYLSILEGMGPESRERLPELLQRFAEAVAGSPSDESGRDPRGGAP
jgi:DNA-binding MarR family transcriptional regulator